MTEIPFQEPEDVNPFEPVMDNEGQLATLARALRHNRDFALFCTVCNSNTLRKDIIRQIGESVPERRMEELRAGVPTESLLDTLRAWKRGRTEFPDVLMVTGLEAWLPTGEEGENHPFVKNLNAARNHFPNVFHGALMLWLGEYHLSAIATGAPDFISVRSGIFFFSATSEEGQEMRHVIESMGLDRVSGLTFAERNRRLDELTALLEEIRQAPEEERDIDQERRITEAVAEILHAMHRFKDEEPLLRRLLDLAEKQHGTNAPEVAVWLNNMAILLDETNRPDQAALLKREVLEIDEKAYGPDHPTVASDLINLAHSLEGMNRLGEAERLARRALKTDLEAHGPHHPAVARDLSELAGVLKKTDRLVEAELLMRQMLQIEEIAYGPEHPNVAIGLNNLGLLLNETNRLDEAEPLMRRAVVIYETTYGPDHPAVAEALNNLVRLLWHTNRLPEAESLMRRALEILLIFTRDTGHCNPRLEPTTHNYRKLLKDMGTPDTTIEKEIAGLFQKYGVELEG